MGKLACDGKIRNRDFHVQTSRPYPLDHEGSSEWEKKWRVKKNRNLVVGENTIRLTGTRHLSEYIFVPVFGWANGIFFDRICRILVLRFLRNVSDITDLYSLSTNQPYRFVSFPCSDHSNDEGRLVSRRPLFRYEMQCLRAASRDSDLITLSVRYETETFLTL